MLSCHDLCFLPVALVANVRHDQLNRPDVRSLRLVPLFFAWALWSTTICPVGKKTFIDRISQVTGTSPVSAKPLPRNDIPHESHRACSSQAGLQIWNYRAYLGSKRHISIFSYIYGNQNLASVFHMRVFPPILKWSNTKSHSQLIRSFLFTTCIRHASTNFTSSSNAHLSLRARRISDLGIRIEKWHN